jgi:hypothetical protein
MDVPILLVVDEDPGGAGGAQRRPWPPLRRRPRDSTTVFQGKSRSPGRRSAGQGQAPNGQQRWPLPRCGPKGRGFRVPSATPGQSVAALSGLHRESRAGNYPTRSVLSVGSAGRGRLGRRARGRGRRRRRCDCRCGAGGLGRGERHPTTPPSSAMRTADQRRSVERSQGFLRNRSGPCHDRLPRHSGGGTRAASLAASTDGHPLCPSAPRGRGGTRDGDSIDATEELPHIEGSRA